MSAHTGYWDDPERDDTTVTGVRGPHAGYYEVTRDDGWSCSISAEYGVEPKVGDRLVTWGSIGRPIRGQAINGRVLYYRSAAEQAIEDAKQAEAWRAEKIAKYESERAKWDARVSLLPDPLRQRVEDFRAFGGDEWRWSHESYEVMCCEEAARLAARFPTASEIRHFSELGYEDQRAAFPEMDDGHSGNSWGFSIRLAYLLVARPDLVPLEHGALCPLVGCKDYGCVPARRSA